MAERVGAGGTDAYSLLAAIGRDGVDALQCVPDDAGDGAHRHDPPPTPLDEDQVSQIADLARASLGIDAGEDADFRISVAGAQEVTAFLRLER